MSSNNQLIIKQNKLGYFEVHENPCVDNDFKTSKKSQLVVKKNLEEAYKFAQDYCDKELVEYGIYIHPNCWEKRK